MNTEQKTLLTLLGDFISGKETVPDAEPDWQTVTELSRQHQITGIVYYQTKNAAPPETKAELQKTYFSYVSNYANRLKLLKKIDGAFSENGIPYLIFKGTENAKYYPVPALRTMIDCDILVHEEDKERAGDLLLSLGFTGDDRHSKEWFFEIKGMEFELHHRLLYEEPATRENEIGFCDRAWEYAHPAEPDGGSTRYSLEPEFHFVYLLLHLKKHLLNDGAGLRHFLDLQIRDKYSGMDEEKVGEMLREVGMERFAAVCRELCGRWFNDTRTEGVIDEEFYEKVTEEVFGDGVFGQDLGKSGDLWVMNNVRSNGKVRSILLKIFPSYQMLCQDNRFAFVRNKPFLMPAAWVYRFFLGLKNGRIGDSRKYVSGVLAGGEKINEREDTFTKWGI